MSEIKINREFSKENFQEKLEKYKSKHNNTVKFSFNSENNNLSSCEIGDGDSFDLLNEIEAQEILFSILFKKRWIAPHKNKKKYKKKLFTISGVTILENGNLKITLAGNISNKNLWHSLVDIRKKN